MFTVHFSGLFPAIESFFVKYSGQPKFLDNFFSPGYSLYVPMQLPHEEGKPQRKPSFPRRGERAAVHSVLPLYFIIRKAWPRGCRGF